MRGLPVNLYQNIYKNCNTNVIVSRLVNKLQLASKLLVVFSISAEQVIFLKHHNAIHINNDFISIDVMHGFIQG